MSGNGKGGGNRRRPFKRRDHETGQEPAPRQAKKNGDSLKEIFRDRSRYEKSRDGMVERLKWSPPKMSTDPIPTPECPYCGKPIRDMALALSDKSTGAPVHFDCVMARVGGGEILDKGDAVTYIGGGRFGVVHFGGPQSPRNFKIKKILEWENKDNRANWRRDISDHYSLT